MCCTYHIRCLKYGIKLRFEIPMTLNLNHVTLNTAHVAVSPRLDVAKTAIDFCKNLIKNSIQSEKPISIPVENIAHYSLKCLEEDGNLVCTIYAPLGPHTKGKIFNGDTMPLITFGVPKNNAHDQVLWDILIKNQPTSLQKPTFPWCGVVLHPTLGVYFDTAEWAGDFERCIAWAWIE